MKYLICSLIFLFSSCDKKELFDKKPDSEQPKLIVEKLKVLGSGDIKLNFIPGEEPNDYSVQLTWPDFDGKVLFSDNESNRKAQDTVANSITLLNLKGGQTYKVKFFIYDSSGRAYDFLKEIFVPEDLVLSGNIKLNDNQSLAANRIFISRDLNLITEDKNLNIIANSIYSESGATISNFDLNSQAKPDSNGLNGGVITIESGSLFGELTINLSGQKGGNGTYNLPLYNIIPSPEPFGLFLEVKKDCPGKSGANAGRRGNLFVVHRETNNLNFKVNYINTPGGLPGPSSSQVSNEEKIQWCQNELWPVQRNSNGKLIPNNPNSYCWQEERCNNSPTLGAPASGGRACFRNYGGNYECR